MGEGFVMCWCIFWSFFGKKMDYRRVTFGNWRDKQAACGQASSEMLLSQRPAGVTFRPLALRRHSKPQLMKCVFLCPMQIALGSSPPCPTHLRMSKHSPGWPHPPCHRRLARKERRATAPTRQPHVSRPVVWLALHGAIFFSLASSLANVALFSQGFLWTYCSYANGMSALLHSQQWKTRTLSFQQRESLAMLFLGRHQ